jgi:hypothetical protein
MKQQEIDEADGRKGEQVKFGEPYENTRKHSKFDFGEDLTVVPDEIEVDSMLYNLIQTDILENIVAPDRMSF